MDEEGVTLQRIRLEGPELPMTSLFLIEPIHRCGSLHKEAPSRGGMPTLSPQAQDADEHVLKQDHRAEQEAGQSSSR